MGHLAALLHLGDPALTVPAALGIAAWLATARARRAAACWLLLFGAALGLVGADKVAFLGWGVGLPALDYHAASGHAAGVTALWPLLLSLALPLRRQVAAVAGLAAGLLMAALLVSLHEHSVAEALVGWAIGALAGAAALRLPWEAQPTVLHPRWGQTPVAGKYPRYSPATGVCPRSHGPRVNGVATFAVAALALHAAPTGYWLAKTALLVSGQRHLFPLHA